jgi:predicted aminopeptidase
MRADRLLLATLLLPIVLIQSGCSGYLWRAAVQQGKILARREPIAQVLSDPRTDSTLQEKLRLVQEVRRFTETIELTPGKTFTQFAKTDRDPLLWVLLGARPDAFELATWKFPIVGIVPYKGFFEKAEAIEAGTELQDRGYEVSIRGSSAFSSLGWFNDPILTNLLKRDQLEIINTVIHEILHTTVWIPDAVPFNESLANFVGHQGTIAFIEARLAACQGDPQCLSLNLALLERAKASMARERFLAEQITVLHAELGELYSSSRTKAEKLAAREQVFTASMTPLRTAYPTLPILKSINNAEIMQLHLYLYGFDSFQQLFDGVNGSWPMFLEEIRAIKKARPSDPYALLKARVQQLTQ